MFPFYILPFDHRSGFAKELLHATYPLSEEDGEKAKKLKHLIWEAFLDAKSQTGTKGTLGILIDEEFGEEIIAEAKEKQVPHIISVEKSGANTLTFIHGEKFGEHLKRINPTFAKALVNYTLGEEEKNVEQRKKMKDLSDFCAGADIPLLLEILTGRADASTVASIIIELEEAGIRPAIWKLEGFPDTISWERVTRATEIPIVVLGHGESWEEVETWVKAAAQSGVKGFAIGRTIFLKSLQEFVSGTISEETAKKEIADNYLHFIDLWEQYA